MGNKFFTSNDSNKNIIKILARGDNSYGNITHLLRPLNFIKIFAENYQCFAIDKDNTLYSWGLNDYYQLGNEKNENYLFAKRTFDNDNKDPYNFINTFSILSSEPSIYKKSLSLGYIKNLAPIQFPIPPISIFKISCGDGYTIFLDKEGSLYSVGRNDKGQLGFELKFEDSAVVSGIKCKSSLTKISYFEEKKIIIKDIVCGSDFSFAKDDKNEFYSWGNNKNNQLGRDNTITYSFIPEKAEYINKIQTDNNTIIQKLCCGWTHACCYTEKGDCYYWGNPFLDYDKKFKTIKYPLKINIESKIVDISSGFNHIAMIVMNNDRKNLFTLGGNDFGQLGNNKEEVFSIDPQRVIFPEKNSENNEIEEVVCGAFHTICRLKNDLIYGFGQNDNKQVGDYSAEFITWPVKWNYELQEEENEADLLKNKYKEVDDKEIEEKKDKHVLKQILCGNGYTIMIYNKTESNKENNNDCLELEINN